MEKENNIMIMVIYYFKVNSKIGKNMEKEKKHYKVE